MGKKKGKQTANISFLKFFLAIKINYQLIFGI